MENLETKFMLALEKRPFDYMPINIALLDIGNGINYSTISDIDVFTKSYTKEEILDSIKLANIVTDEYLAGNLIVVEIYENNLKYLHKYPVLTNDVTDGFDLISFLYNNLQDKNLMNSLIVKYNNLSNDVELTNEFKQAILNKDVQTIVRILYLMPYIKNRELCLYIIDKLIKKDRSKDLIRKKAA